MAIYLDLDPDIELVDEGVTKQYLIDRAYEDCGLNGFVFRRSPEEDARGLAQLDLMMSEYPWSGMEYNRFVGSPSEPSGLSREYAPAVASHLALRLAPGMGKTLSAEAAAARSRSWHLVMAAVTKAPPKMVR